MTTRRRFIEILPLAGLGLGLGAMAACGDKAAETPVAPAPAPAAAPPAPAMEAAPAPVATPPDTASLPLVSEGDALAQSLGYVAVAGTVDKTRYPQYAEGQKCANCALYGAAADSAQGPCPLFAGRQVLATAWCSSYVRKG